MSAPIALPADVYDTLEFSALAFGGIGGQLKWDFQKTPCCAFGHLVVSGVLEDQASWPGYDFHGLTPEKNDAAVSFHERISFPEWCRRLNVVRGA